MVLASLNRDAKDVAGYGVGFACTASDAGAFPVSTAQVRVQTDGSVTVLSGSTEMGQGSRSALAQIASHELGIDMSRVHECLPPQHPDTVPGYRTAACG